MKTIHQTLLRCQPILARTYLEESLCPRFEMPNSRPYVVILTRRWPTMNRQVLFCFYEFIHNLASFQRFWAEVWLPLLKFDDQYGLSPSKSGFIISGRFYSYLEDPEIPGAFAQVLFAQFRYCARR